MRTAADADGDWAAIDEEVAELFPDDGDQRLIAHIRRALVESAHATSALTRSSRVCDVACCRWARYRRRR